MFNYLMTSKQACNENKASITTMNDSNARETDLRPETDGHFGASSRRLIGPASKN